MKQKIKRTRLKFKRRKPSEDEKKEELRAEIEKETEIFLENSAIEYLGYRKPEPINPANVGVGATSGMIFKQLCFH